MDLIKAVAVCLLLSLNCGDDEPSREETCAASCEERGGSFYMMDGAYCYCAWYDGGAD